MQDKKVVAVGKVTREGIEYTKISEGHMQNNQEDQSLPELPFITSVYRPGMMEGFKGFVDLKAIRKHIMSLMGEYERARIQQANNPDETRWHKVMGIYMGLEMALDEIDREINNHENA